MYRIHYLHKINHFQMDLFTFLQYLLFRPGYKVETVLFKPERMEQQSPTFLLNENSELISTLFFISEKFLDHYIFIVHINAFLPSFSSLNSHLYIEYSAHAFSLKKKLHTHITPLVGT